MSDATEREISLAAEIDALLVTECESEGTLDEVAHRCHAVIARALAAYREELLARPIVQSVASDSKDDPTGIPEFDAFRALVRAGIAAALKRDGYHKRFEGAMSYSMSLPPVVDWERAGMPDPLGRQPEMQPEHVVHLYCYVLGPSRQYQWKANTRRGVFEKATRDFRMWMAEDEAEDAEENGPEVPRA